MVVGGETYSACGSGGRWPGRCRGAPQRAGTGSGVIKRGYAAAHEPAGPKPCPPPISQKAIGRVEFLREALRAPLGNGPIVLEAARALIERVEVHPASALDCTLTLTLLGELPALFRAGGVGVEYEKGPTLVSEGPDLFSCSVKVDAGTRNRRSQYIEVAI